MTGDKNKEILSEDVQKAETIKAKWKPLIESKDDTGEDLGFQEIKSYDRKRITAILLENTEKDYLKENTTTGVDNVDPVLINLVRRTAPNLMAFDIVGVQPMTMPTGLIFAMRAHKGAQPQGPFGKPGDARNGFQSGAAEDSQGDTPAEQWGIDGVATNEILFNEADTKLTGKGTQTSNATAPDYNAYSVGRGMSTSEGETLGGSGGGDLAWSEASMTIEKSSVEAKTRGMKADYTTELAQDLKSVHGLDAEAELSNILSTEMIAEENREMINTVRQIAVIAPAEATYLNGSVVLDSAGAPVLGTAGLFDLDANSDGRWQAEKFKALLMKINKEANAIAKATRRGRGNFLIVSSDVASALDLAGKLDYAPALDNNLNVDDTGNTFVGTLQGRFKVYVDPYLGYDEVIVGYKGANQMDAGVFYCPYVPLQMHKTVDPNTFQPKIAFKKRYGIVANPFTTLQANKNLYYRKFKVGNL